MRCLCHAQSQSTTLHFGNDTGHLSHQAEPSSRTIKLNQLGTVPDSGATVAIVSFSHPGVQPAWHFR
jgi:hypothetical protein